MVFLDPSAAKGANSRELFATRKGLEAKLRAIVDHIVGSVRVPQSPMTFAIYGPWGAGKSSALNWLMDELDSHKRRDGLPLTMSTYSAPLWRHFTDVRATLAYEIMNGISQDQPEALHDITQTLADLLGLKFSAHPDESSLHVAVTFMTILARLPNAPAVVEAELQRRARRLRDTAAGGELRPVHVQFIDDLDRCDLEFTASLLHAMHYWQNTDYCVMFVVAASKDHVYRAFAEHPAHDGKDPRQALEKYIHLSVDLPELLVTPREVAVFLHQLVARVTAEGGLAVDVAGELDRTIDASVQDYPRGVLAPLLRIGGGSVTPRAVKHRLNTFLSDLSAHDGPLDPQTWKNLMIRSYWPEFWSRDVAPLEHRPTTVDLVWQGRLERVVRLRAVGRELLRFWDMDAADVAPMLSHLGRRYGIDVDGVDPILAMYLAAEPAWEPPYVGGDDGPAQPAVSGGTLEAPGLRDGDERSSQEPLPPRDEALLVSIQAEQAANQGDAVATRSHLLRVVELFRTQPPNTINAEERLRPYVGSAAVPDGRVGTVSAEVKAAIDQVRQVLRDAGFWVTHAERGDQQLTFVDWRYGVAGRQHRGGRRDGHPARVEWTVGWADGVLRHVVSVDGVRLAEWRSDRLGDQVTARTRAQLDRFAQQQVLDLMCLLVDALERGSRVPLGRGCADAVDRRSGRSHEVDAVPGPPAPTDVPGGENRDE